MFGRGVVWFSWERHGCAPHLNQKVRTSSSFLRGREADSAHPFCGGGTPTLPATSGAQVRVRADCVRPAQRALAELWRLLRASSPNTASVLGSWGNTMRDAVRNKEWCKRSVLGSCTPTQDPSTDLQLEPPHRLLGLATRTLSATGQTRVNLSLW